MKMAAKDKWEGEMIGLFKKTDKSWKPTNPNRPIRNILVFIKIFLPTKPTNKKFTFLVWLMVSLKKTDQTDREYNVLFQITNVPYMIVCFIVV